MENSIVDAISRTRQLMQESRELTKKNFQRKTMLEEKFQFNSLNPDKEYSNSNNSEIVRRVSEIELRNQQDSPFKQGEDSSRIEELQNEIVLLKQKVSDQALRIKLLENNLAEVNLEKMQLLQELKIQKKENKAEIERLLQKYERDEENEGKNSEDEEILEIKQRILILEQKYQQQLKSNEELLENIGKIQKNSDKNKQNEKIQELEELLRENISKYKGLKERLEKTESIIALDKINYSPNTSLSKKTLTSPRNKKKKKTTLTKTNSSSSNFESKGIILHRIKR